MKTPLYLNRIMRDRLLRNMRIKHERKMIALLITNLIIALISLVILLIH